MKEAEATVSFLNSCKTIFGESDVLLMGDFNAYPLEDPMQVLYRANYGSALLRFDADTAYSYSYQATVGALDQILANESMSPQITGASVFHINADEPSFLDYSGTYVNNMYRCSDHDPVVVGLHLGGSSSDINGIIGPEIAISPNPTSDEVTIYNARNYRLRIFNNVGQLIATEFIESNFQLLSTEQFGLNKGIYLLQFKENKIIEPKTIVLKLIIN